MNSNNDEPTREQINRTTELLENIEGSMPLQMEMLEEKAEGGSTVESIRYWIPGEDIIVGYSNFYEYNAAGTRRNYLQIWADGRVRFERSWVATRRHGIVDQGINVFWQYDSGHPVKVLPNYRQSIEWGEGPHNREERPLLDVRSDYERHFDLFKRDDITCYGKFSSSNRG